MLEQLIFTSGSNPKNKNPLSVDLAPLTIFVGPNNSGKSRALIDIEKQLTVQKSPPGNVISKVIIKPLSNIEAQKEIESLSVEPNQHERHEGHRVLSRLNLSGEGRSRTLVYLQGILKEFSHPNDGIREYICQYYSLLTLRLDGKSRLSLTANQKTSDLQCEPNNNLSFLFKNNKERNELRNIVLDAFGKYTHFADASRLRTWIETGKVMPVPAAALSYKKQKAAQMAAAGSATGEQTAQND